MDYENGKPKPGGKLLPDPLFLSVQVEICPKCKRIEKRCRCEKK